MPIFKEEHIAGISFTSTVAIVLLFTLSAGGLVIHQKKTSLARNLARIEASYNQRQQERLKTDVTLEIRRIQVLKASAESKLESRLQQRVDEVHDLALRLHTLNPRKSPAETRALIRDALGAVRFNNGTGYFFILDDSGRLILHPPDPSLEGRIPGADLAREYETVLKKIHLQIRSQGSGFLRYNWIRPGSPKDISSPKLAYVRVFEPFGWIIGTGEYIERIEAMIQEEIITHLNELVPDILSPDYFFIYQPKILENGDEVLTLLVNPNRPELLDTPPEELEKIADGFTFRKTILKKIREDGEGFVTYLYKKPGHDQALPKLSYFPIRAYVRTDKS